MSLKNFSVGFKGLSNNLTDAEIKGKFGGVPTSGVTAKKNETITVGLDLRVSRSSHRGEPFIQTGMEYERQSTGDVAPQISQSKNKATLESGYVLNLRGGRSSKRIGLVFSGYGETQSRRSFTNFDLGTGDTLKISQARSFLMLGRAGFRWQNGLNSFEVGVQTGREFHSVVGYRFPGTTVECLPEPAQSFAACIKNASKAGSAITKDSVGEAILANRPRAGFYWKTTLSVPINDKVKYDFTQTGDFYFTLSGDNATNTRFRDESKHTLKFEIWPSLSIGPSFRLFVYENKIDKTRLFQKEFGFETSLRFDLFNRREKLVQIKHKR